MEGTNYLNGNSPEPTRSMLKPISVRCTNSSKGKRLYITKYGKDKQTCISVIQLSPSEAKDLGYLLIRDSK